MYFQIYNSNIFKTLYMNVFIPTEDGITINPFFEEARRFRFLSIINGSVRKDEIRVTEQEFDIDALNREGKPEFRENSGPDPGACFTENICMIITNSISKSAETKLNDNHCEVLITTETNITNAIMYYLKYHAKQESDYCCCP
jgi:predicted Fe-Mo cluster-binding NifX family protein